MIYLDNAATSFPKPEGVYRALDSFARESLANPGRAGHRMAIGSERLLEDTRHLLNQLFEGEGPERFAFTLNATDALNRLQRGDKIDPVLSDVVMPGGMNGIALAQEISNHYPQIPVLLTSGYSDVVQSAQSQFAILRKPFQLPVLEKSVREALERGAARDGDRVLQFARWRGSTTRDWRPPELKGFKSEKSGATVAERANFAAVSTVCSVKWRTCRV